jgi:hypothetical protein
VAGLLEDATVQAERPQDDFVAEAVVAAVHLSRVCDRTVTSAAIRGWESRGHVHRIGWHGRAALYSLNELEKFAMGFYAGDLTTL